MNDETAVQVAEKFDIAPTELFGGATGLENMDRECLTLPFLKIAQDVTEQAKRGSMSRIDGLAAGMFFCPATKQVYGEEFRGIILKFYRNFAVYDGESVDSKFLGTITAAEFKSTVENAPGSKRVKSYTVDANGHRYVDTRNFVVMSLDHPEHGEMLLALTSSNIKPSRNLMTQATTVQVNRAGKLEQAPLWASVWSLKVSFFQNPPYSYYAISDTNRLGWVPKDLAPAIKSKFESLLDMKIETAVDEDVEHDAPAPVSPPPAQASAVNRVFGGEPQPLF